MITSDPQKIAGLPFGIREKGVPTILFGSDKKEDVEEKLTDMNNRADQMGLKARYELLEA